MKHLIIGTAGHVDHGKTALIRALTGTDTDRLKEEKERGISIDLGFASLPLTEQLQAGIVDVPGHERFLKNMLAGTGGMDLAILTIAADEGVMPQTREHLAMLELFGVRHGMVVITKIDKVDDEWLSMVQDEIRTFLAGTFLAEAPVCLVSSFTGAGLDELKQQLVRLGENIPGRDAAAPFRLWIDRAFTVKGHGVVVTGTALSGRVSIGDALTLYPDGGQVRVRGLETHGRRTDRAVAGQRTAINLAGVELAAVKRGMTVSDMRRGEIGRYWDASVDWQQPVEAGCRIRLHLGTGEFIGRIYKAKRAPEGQYRLVLEQPVGAGAGDRGILRRYSPPQLLGGVVLLGAAGERTREHADKRAMAAAYERGDGKLAAASILTWQPVPVSLEDVRRQAGYLPDSVIDQGLASLVKEGSVVRLDSFYMSRQRLTEAKDKLRSLLEDYHRRRPERFGMPAEELRQKLKLTERLFEVLAGHLTTEGLIAVSGGEAALTKHAGSHRDWRRTLEEEAEILFKDSGLINIDVDFINRQKNLPPPQAQKYLEALVKEGIVLRLGGGIHVYRKTIQYIVEVIHEHFRVQPTLTVAELRDKLNTSRKSALPVLEYLDVHKYTIRREEVRYPGPRIKDFSEKTIF